MTDTDAVADQIVAAWAALAADTSALDDGPQLDQPGGRDWAGVLLVEHFRAGIGAAVVEILQQLPLPVAGLAFRDVVMACNAEFAPIALRVADAAAAGEGVNEIARAAVAEAEPHLRAAVSLAVERAVLRG